METLSLAVSLIEQQSLITKYYRSNRLTALQMEKSENSRQEIAEEMVRIDESLLHSIAV